MYVTARPVLKPLCNPIQKLLEGGAEASVQQAALHDCITQQFRYALLIGCDSIASKLAQHLELQAQDSAMYRAFEVMLPTCLELRRPQRNNTEL